MDEVIFSNVPAGKPEMHGVLDEGIVAGFSRVSPHISPPILSLPIVSLAINGIT
jgi:hypothetical protein